MTLSRPNDGDLLAGIDALVSELERLMIQQVSPQAGRHIAFGTGAVTWGGIAAVSNGAVIAHGLGVVPAVVIVVADTAAGRAGATVHAAVQVSSLSATNFTAFMRDVDNIAPGAGAPGGFYWLAIG